MAAENKTSEQHSPPQLWLTVKKIWSRIWKLVVGFGVIVTTIAGLLQIRDLLNKEQQQTQNSATEQIEDDTANHQDELLITPEDRLIEESVIATDDATGVADAADVDITLDLPVLSSLYAGYCQISTQFYSGPGENYWKNDDLWTYPSDGYMFHLFGFTGDWILVKGYSEYDGDFHIGWVRRDAVSDTYLFSISELKFNPVSMMTTGTTWCTDQPDNGQEIIMRIPEGYTLSALATYGDWIYCECYVDDGIPIRVFVPKDDLKIVEQ